MRYIKFKIIFIFTILIISISACTTQHNKNLYTEFNPNPNYYKTAKMSKDVTIPKYITGNIERKDFYKVPVATKTEGDINVSELPPTLIDKIKKYY